VLDFDRIPSHTEWRDQIFSVTDSDIQDIARGVFHEQPFATAEIRPSA
jgi:hypothetical protein